jgi:hypothetical protein
MGKNGIKNELTTRYRERRRNAIFALQVQILRKLSLLLFLFNIFTAVQARNLTQS